MTAVTVTMDPVRIILAGAWISLMLIYLLGDVLRIYAGHHTPGEIAGTRATGGMWLFISVVMLVPIVMILVSLMVPAGPLVWISVIVSGGFVLFNLFGLPYKGAFDNFLIVVSFGVNALIIWQALAWRPLEHVT